MSAKASQKKPARGNVAHEETSAVPSPELAYSKREEFRWLKAAVLLEQTNMEVGRTITYPTMTALLGAIDAARHKQTDMAAERGDAQIRDVEIPYYYNVRQSANRAEQMLFHLQLQNVSQDELFGGKMEKGTMTFGGLRLDEKKVVLRRHFLSVMITGNLPNSATCRYVIEKARREGDVKFFKRLGAVIGHALSLPKTTPPVMDKQIAGRRRGPGRAGQVSDLAKFLVENWCGNDDQGRYDDWIRWLKKKRVGKWSEVGAFVWTKSRSTRRNNHFFFFMPPLCFFSPRTLGVFCALRLGESYSDRFAAKIRQWVTKLELERVRPAIIRGVREPSKEGREAGSNRIYFES
jgi:hypothetical protein